MRAKMRKIGFLISMCISSVMVYGQKLAHPVAYSAQDSMVMKSDGTATLHGNSTVKYETMDLESEFIRFHMDSSLLYATGVYDSINEEWRGKPVFKEGKDSYESKELTYNMQTQKGYIRNVVTQQGEGYIVASKSKKSDNNSFMIGGGMYTTCDDHEHPHFYLKMTKAKVVPKKHISTGPAYMVVGEVPLPIAIPFGFFPFTDSYSSGLIMPTFGDDYSRGLYLRGIGYYWAINDYLDLTVTGDIYTRGTWAIYAKSKYIKRYKFNGNISINYREDITSEVGLPDYSKAQNLSIQWTHTQDSKANPYTNFSASVNFSTSGYNRSNINSYYNGQLNSENTKSSSISYTQRFPNSPWSISMSALISQRTKDSTLSLTLPDLTVSMSRIYPFKRKNPIGKERWYEKISLSYTGNAKIAANSMKENYIFRSNFLKDWKTGLRHTITSNASFMLFKYISITPSISMTDRMYFSREERHWDYENQSLARDTTTGFYNVFDFNVGVSMSTKLYGFYTPFRKLFPHSKVDKFRHMMTPHVSFSYHPDFGNQWWNYYGTYEQPVYSSERDAYGKLIQKIDAEGNPMYITQKYSKFQGQLYGNASQGMAATLSFGVENNLEMKVVNSKDTTGTKPFKVISLIDNLGINGAYNFAADSMNFSNFNINLRIKIPKINYTINLSTQLDPYMYQLNAFGTPVRTNKQYWHNGRFPHWTGTGASFSYTFSNDLFKKWFGKDHTKNKANTEPVTVDESGEVRNAKTYPRHDKQSETDNDGYEKLEMPWSLTVSYSIRYGAGGEFDYEKMYYKMVLTHNLSFSGSLSLGKGWKISATTSYDFKAHQFSYTNFNISRDLHCWNMTASFVPFGPYASYTFHIGVNASMLADLKYDQSSTNNTNKRITWW